ncbi:chemotaxis-specific protein-glutamate methyltransferase CheB [Nitrospira sp. Kam-Ns4a]
MVRVLVAEDSAVTREYLVRLLSEDPALHVVGTVRNGQDAVAEAERLRPDVILMDIHMPVMNGYEATRRIMERVPTPIIMISTSLARSEVAMALEALKAGAVTVLDKPPGPDHPDRAKAARQIQETIRLMAEVKVVRRWPHRERAAPGPPAAPARVSIRIVAIGASTGGPTVLAEILSALPADFPVPILAVQHIAPGFAPGLAEWVGRETVLPVKLAESGEPARPGTVYLAPHGSQMGIGPDGRIRLTRHERPAAENGFCPSVSYLFYAVARSFGRTALGILLTGMGQDGAAGLLALRQAGGVTIAQDEASSVIFGMPGEAVRLGAAQYVLSPGQIADLLRGLGR